MFDRVLNTPLIRHNNILNFAKGSRKDINNSIVLKTLKFLLLILQCWKSPTVSKYANITEIYLEKLGYFHNSLTLTCFSNMMYNKNYFSRTSLRMLTETHSLKLNEQARALVSTCKWDFLIGNVALQNIFSTWDWTDFTSVVCWWL